MRVRRRSRPPSVTVEAAAKLNLALAVGPRRRDGFHELATIFQSISLSDTLTARPAKRFSLRVRFENVALRGMAGALRVPTGGANLVLRAARAVARRAGLATGARFELTKRIPSQAGLGGGSADAAATILALDRLYRLRLGRAVHLELAAQVGSDVSFALLGGTAFGRGRGERLTSLRGSGSFRAVVAVPRWRVSTARAFAEIDRKKFGLTVWRSKLRSLQRLSARKLKPERALGLGNAFEFALGKRRADFESLCHRLEAAGSCSPTMTGSGSAVFALLPKGKSAAAVCQRFRGDEVIFAVRSRRKGLRVTGTT